MTHRRRLLATYGGYEGPLDIVPGAVVAYGQRALSSAKRGTALYTIRESGGDTTQSFSSDASTGEAPAAAVTTFLNGNDGFGTVWMDQGTAEANVLQATANLQLEWLAGEVNTRPAFVWVGLDFKRMVSTATFDWNGGAATIFLVAKNNIQVLADSALEYVDLQVGTNNWISLSDNTGAVAGGAYTVDMSSYRVIDCICETGLKNYKSNGANQTLDTDFDADGPIANLEGLTMRVGKLSNEASGGIAEVLMYAEILTDQQRSDIRSNIATYYGITL